MDKAVTSGVVFDIMRFSIHDGPGIRTTVFLKGCPLGCVWCHNPESQEIVPELMFRPGLCIGCKACVDACEQGAIKAVDENLVTDLAMCTRCAACVEVCYAGAREMVGAQMTDDEVMAVIARDMVFYDQSGGGVTFSGGEALLQHEFLLALLEACQAHAIHTAVDTSGYAPWGVVDRLRERIDLFLYDLKTLDEQRHEALTGVSNTLVIENLQRLSRLGHAIILRVPLIPGVNDGVKELQQMGAFAAALPNLERLDLLPYHQTGIEKYCRLNKTYQMSPVEPLPEEYVQEAAELLRGFSLSIQVGG